MPKPNINNISPAKFKLDPERIQRARESEHKPELAVEADDFVHLAIAKSADEIKAKILKTTSSIPKAKKLLSQELFNPDEDDQEMIENETLKPMQERFVREFFQFEGNYGMAFRTGIGKTLTFLKVAERMLEENPHKYVIITTPTNYLAKQIVDKGVNLFASLQNCREQILEAGKNPKPYEKMTREEQKLANSIGYSYEEDYEKLRFPTDSEQYLELLDKYELPETTTKEEIKQVLNRMVNEELNEYFPESNRRLIVNTPQAVESMFKKGLIDPSDVQLLILDEGTVGSIAQTKKYATYRINDLLKEAKANFRTIVADGTPMEIEHITEEFGIKHWAFGEEEVFVAPSEKEILSVKKTEKHEKILKKMEQILVESYSLFEEFCNACTSNPETSTDFSEVLDIAPYMKGKNANYLKYDDYDLMKRTLNHRIGEDKYNPDNYEAKSLLEAYHRNQRIYDILQKEGYASAINKISEFEQRDPKKSERTRLRSFQTENEKGIKKSNLIKLKKDLESRVKAQELHPKEVALKELLHKINAEGKQALILCNQIETQNRLCALCNNAWGIKTGSMHGGNSKQNQLLQRFVVNRFVEGDFRHIVATQQMGERGLDIPEIDYVVCYSPSQNAASQLQARGRLRKGGKLFILAMQGSETGKAFKNERQQAEYFQKREILMDRERMMRSDAETDFKSSFSGKKKEDFFAADIQKSNPDTLLNRLVYERFLIKNIIRTSSQQDRKGNVSYYIKLELQDKTGTINYFYNFDNKEDADEKSQQLKVGMPVIVSGKIRKAKKRGNIYLQGTHTPGYFQEGVIPCPKEDADIENLRYDENLKSEPQPKTQPQPQPENKKEEKSFIEPDGQQSFFEPLPSYYYKRRKKK